MNDSSDACGSHLGLVNLVLALSTYHPRFPHPLRELGFHEDLLVEWSFLNSEDEEVSFDVIANSVGVGHALLFEAKAGIDDPGAHTRFRDQLRRHRAITTTQVRDSGITLGETDPTFDIALLCISGREGRALDALMSSDPHILVVADLVRVDGTCCLRSAGGERGSFTHADVDSGLEISLDPPLPIPDHFIPFDENTSLVVVAAEVMPLVQKYYLETDRQGFTQSELAEEAIPAWPLLHPKTQTGLATRVKRTLQGLAQTLGHSGFEWDNNEREWVFRQSVSERNSGSPPTLNRSIIEALSKEWNLPIYQLDAFVSDPSE